MAIFLFESATNKCFQILGALRSFVTALLSFAPFRMSPRSADLSVVGGGDFNPSGPIDLGRGGPAAGGGGGGMADDRLGALGCWSCCCEGWGPETWFEITG